MKRIPKRIFLFLFLFMMLVYLPSVIFAQDDTPPNPCNDPFNPPCPIDGGVTALLAIGVGYGIKKYKDTRKSSTQIQDPVSK